MRKKKKAKNIRNTYTHRGTYKSHKNSKLEIIMYKQKTSIVKELPKESI